MDIDTRSHQTPTVDAGSSSDVEDDEYQTPFNTHATRQLNNKATNNPHVSNAAVSEKQPDPVPDSNLNKSSFLHIHPKVIHFPSYKLNTKHTQRIEVINQGGSKLRVQYRSSQNPSIKLLTGERKGVLHPGGEEFVTVQFIPTEWKYYFDVVKIWTSEGEHVEIPVHCYPVMNKLEFPQKMDLGKCPLNSTKRATIPLKCSVPIDFEYSIRVLEAVPKTAWVVEPLEGVIEASGQVDIEVAMTPLNLQTCYLRLELNISQFGFTPLICEFYGMGVMPKPDEYLSEDAKKIMQSNALSKLPKSKFTMNTKSIDKMIKEIDTQAADIPDDVFTKKTAIKSSKVVINSKKVKPVPAPNQDTKKSDESVFFSEVQKKRQYEQLKELRRFVCVGEDDPEVFESEEPLPESMPTMENAFGKNATDAAASRVDAGILKGAIPIASKDGATSEKWQNKYYFQRLFQKAIWTIVYRNRLMKRLQLIRTHFATIANVQPVVAKESMFTESTRQFIDAIESAKSNPALESFGASLTTLQAISVEVPELKKVKFSQPVELKAPFEYQTLGYDYMTYTGIYLPFMEIAERSMRDLDHHPKIVPKLPPKVEVAEIIQSNSETAAEVKGNDAEKKEDEIKESLIEQEKEKEKDHEAGVIARQTVSGDTQAEKEIGEIPALKEDDKKETIGESQAQDKPQTE